MKNNFFTFSLISCLAGIVLLVVNIFGLFTSLRSPYLSKDILLLENEGPLLSNDQVFHSINTEFSDKETFLKKTNSTIHNALIHYWEDEGAYKYNLHVPIQENFILYFAGLVYPEKFGKYEFFNYHKALERGVGLCSQHSIILSEILHEHGYKSKMVGLDGHVVVTALVNDEINEWWILDPDYGVVIPHSLAEIESNPSIISTYYTDQGYVESTITSLIEIYQFDGNKIYEGYGVGDYSLLLQYFEIIASILIWIIPILLFIPIFVYLSKSHNNAFHSSKFLVR